MYQLTALDSQAQADPCRSSVVRFSHPLLLTRRLRRKPYSYNWDRAYANGFPVLVEGREEFMLRTCSIEVNMSFWVEDIPLDACLGFEASVTRRVG